jgi:SAM-dependent methyltransferase
MTTKILRCPECRLGSLVPARLDGALTCDGCRIQFRMLRKKPVLIRTDNVVFSPGAYQERDQPLKAKPWLYTLVPGPSTNLSRARVLKRLADSLPAGSNTRVLAVGGGTQRAALDGMLNRSQIVYIDVDAAADVDFFADAHELPFHDQSFDAVITTAVLEHVLHPETVVSEIHRVLAQGGLLYSELPFMQQVHEGAYDFMRFTLGGHRRLLNRFQEIEGGMVAGPGTALVWALENFALSFFSGRGLRKLVAGTVRIVLFWIKYFDYAVARKPQALDGASCTFFFGRKIQGRIPDSAIISAYEGAKHVRHV